MEYLIGMFGGAHCENSGEWKGYTGRLEGMHCENIGEWNSKTCRLEGRIGN